MSVLLSRARGSPGNVTARPEAFFCRAPNKPGPHPFCLNLADMLISARAGSANSVSTEHSSDVISQ